jgi:hypothetical protein
MTAIPLSGSKKLLAQSIFSVSRAIANERSFNHF